MELFFFLLVLLFFFFSLSLALSIQLALPSPGSALVLGEKRRSFDRNRRGTARGALPFPIRPIWLMPLSLGARRGVAAAAAAGASSLMIRGTLETSTIERTREPPDRAAGPLKGKFEDEFFWGTENSKQTKKTRTLFVLVNVSF